jgi:ribosomal 50S subunit-associated protein YjgA (DUF615 family)
MNLPTIEELAKALGTVEIDRLEDDNQEFFITYRAQAFALLHIAQELEAINNNLEALRPPQLSSINLRATLDAHAEEITLLRQKIAEMRRDLPKGYSL